MSEPVWVPLGAQPTIPWQIVFTALGQEPPASAMATLDTRNTHPVLDFDAAVNEYTNFRGVLPAAYTNRGVNVKLIWTATTAVTGNVVWVLKFERLNLGASDLDADSFAPDLYVPASAADATSGETSEATLAVAHGANMDGLLGGEMFRLRVIRAASDAADTMAGDAELIAIVITEQ